MMIIHKEMNDLKSNPTSLHATNGNADDLNLKYLAIKQCVLSLFAVGSTIFLAAIIVIFHITQTFATLDVVISLLCVIMMYKWNDGLYPVFCWCCLKCIDHESESSQRRADKKVTPELELDVVSNSSDIPNKDKQAVIGCIS